MSFQDLGALGEMIGGVAVIASLLYLAAQIRQNSAIARNATTQTILGMSTQTNTAVAGDVSPVMAKISQGEELDAVEQFRFFSYLMAVFAMNWQAHYQHTRGLIEPEVFLAYERRIENILSLPRVREFWQENRFRFSDSFQEYIDEIVQRAAGGGTLPE